MTNGISEQDAYFSKGWKYDESRRAYFRMIEPSKVLSLAAQQVRDMGYAVSGNQDEDVAFFRGRQALQAVFLGMAYGYAERPRLRVTVTFDDLDRFDERMRNS